MRGEKLAARRGDLDDAPFRIREVDIETAIARADPPPGRALFAFADGAGFQHARHVFKRLPARHDPMRLIGARR